MKNLLQSAQILFLESNNNVSLLANASAFIYDMVEHLNWVGFYLYNGNTLEVGPFQGKPACVSISIGNGVCGTAFLKQEIQNVPDVHKFKEHIPCDGASNSELVIPLTKKGIQIGVLDIDSPLFNRFDPETVSSLVAISELILEHYQI